MLNQSNRSASRPGGPVRARARASVRRVIAVQTACGIACASAGLFVGSGVSQAQSVPQSPNDSNFASQWTNSSARDGSTHNDIAVDISSVTPSLPTLGESVSFQVTFTNSTKSTLTHFSYSLDSSDPVFDTASARLRMVDGSAVFAHSLGSGRLQVNGGKLEPNKSVTVKVTLDTRGGSSGSQPPTTTTSAISASLNAERAGIYPIVVSAHGTHSDASGDSVSGSSRFLLPLGDSNKKVAASKRSPLTFIWPLAASSPVVPGETGEAPAPAPLLLSNDSLADELKPGGRLDNLLSAYASAKASHQGLAAASCLAIDPDTLTTINRMTSGYSIASDRPSAVKETTRLRDSWGKNNSVHTTAGSGQQAAADWLNKLKKTADGSCVVALPTAGANLDSVAKTADPWLEAQALSTGSMIIQSILGVTAQSNVVIPGSGYVEQDTVPTLTNAYTNGQTVDLGAMYEQAKQAADNSQASEIAGGTGTGSSASSSASASQSAQAAQPAQSNQAAGSNQNTAPITPLHWPLPDARVTTLVADNTLTRQSGGTSQSNSSAESSTSDQSAATDSPADLWRDQVTDLGHGVTAAPFNADVGATLAGTGTDPQTMGYTTALTRYTEDLDSPAARMQDAIAMMWQSTQSSAPVLAVPPAEWTATKDDASAFLEAISTLLDRSAQATPLSTITAQTPQSASAVSLPFDDPGVPTDVDIRQAQQQSASITALTNMMSNDPHIALTPFGFTEPLRTELLRTLTDDMRRNRRKFDSVSAETESDLSANSSTLQVLSSAVVLVPPGNVYTRTSASSPLLIVARNGLPLPVPTTLKWNGAQGVSLSNTSQVVPARGSITLQVHATIPESPRQTKLTLWLAGQGNQAISEPVEVAIQSAPGLTTPGIIAIGAGLAVVAATGYIVRGRRRKKDGKS